jgi:hypothetical protein
MPISRKDGELPITLKDGELPITLKDGELPITLKDGELPISRKDGERGFALLLVFLMAAAVALVLYQAMPRVAFESEREKEQLLQDRGHEYVRAIQLYYIAFKKYPTKIEDLENTNNKRFLRRRYIDPMTGKDEWRLIHVNAAGQLTDSVVQKPPASPTANGQDPNNPSGGPGNGTGTGTGTGTATGTANNTGTGTNTATSTTTSTGTGTDGPPAVNAAVLRRPSDNVLTPPGGLGQPAAVDPNDPRFWAPATTWVPPNQTGNGQTGTQPQGQQFGGQQFPGQPLQGQQNGTQQYPGQQTPVQQYPGQAGPLPGGFQPGLPGQLPFQPNQVQQGTNQFPQNNNQNNNLNQGFGVQNGGGVQGGIMPTGGVYGSPQGSAQNGLTGSIGSGTPGAQGAANPGSNNALGMIQNLLTTPQQPQNGNMTAIGAGGLAGVASTYKAPSIKIYKDRQKYNEWEFIFDLKSAMPGQGQQGTLPGLGQGGPTAPNQNGQPGQNAVNSNSSSNSNSIFGTGSATTPTSGTSAPIIPH